MSIRVAPNPVQAGNVLTIEVRQMPSDSQGAWYTALWQTPGGPVATSLFLTPDCPAGTVSVPDDATSGVVSDGSGLADPVQVTVVP